MDKFLESTRFFTFPDGVWVGRLEDMTGFHIFTMEPPDREKKPHCVLAGLYDLIPYDSPTHGPTWCLHNPDLGVYAGMGEYARPKSLPNAQNFIEMHVGNKPDDSEGCILLGEEWQGKEFIFKSRDALAMLRAHLGEMSTGWKLRISERED